ncbi:polysaccharide pyruvyl transferase family protein [Dietzia cercidiphylli]|uniref:polysaccharide pyruvyl transferase family protein n=1 Tax=Dietzia cercidiphylli TaxID=498199 RepID=UPI003F7DF18B
MGGNYGGMLQAYALQRAIRDLGYNPVTINSAMRFDSGRLAARRVRYLIKRLLRLRLEPLPLSRKQREILQEAPLRFVNENIATVDLHGMSRRARSRELAEAKAIVVGSDQVWRGGMADLSNQFLRFAKDAAIVRISYAASFGGDELIRFSGHARRRAKSLIQKFDAVSVREDEAVGLCDREWGIAAFHHVDPTMLLQREDYEKLARNASTAESEESGKLFVYVLDRNPGTENFVANLQSKLGLEVEEYYMDRPFSARELKSNTARYKMESVERWIANFATASFVVTDSFHGTVFSIIFHKSFIAIGNKHRGLSRFESLLRLLGLESRLVDLDSDGWPIDLSDINWAAVDRRIDLERERSFEYLNRHLN